MTDLARGLSSLSNALGGYQKAENYYSGDQNEWFATGRLATLLRSSGKGFNLNFSHIPVDARLDRLEIAGISVPEQASLDSTLQDIWDDNDILVQEKDLYRTALIYGDAYLIVWPDESGTPQIDVNSPKNVRAMYSSENARYMEFAIKLWQVGAREYRAYLYYSDRIEKYQLVNAEFTEDATKWEVYTGDNDSGLVDNPFGVIPVFHFATRSDRGEQYGTPVHKNAFGAQDAILKLNSTGMAVVDYLGFPVRYVMTQNSGVSQASSDDDWGVSDDSLQGTNNAVANGNGKNSGAPGDILWVEDGKTAGEFSAGDTSQFITYMEFQIKAIAQTTTTPMHYFDPSGDVPSGESLRVADAPLVKSVEDMQAKFTRPMSKALSLALTLAGYPDVRVDVRWGAAQSEDETLFWSIANQKLAAGVPKSQILLEAGYPQDMVDKWELERAAAAPAIESPDSSGNEEQQSSNQTD